MGSIRFEGVSFKYEDRQEFVFRNLSFELQEGQKTAFVGASGCGKSTFLRAVVGTHLPRQGQVLLFPRGTGGAGAPITGPGRDRGIVGGLGDRTYTIQVQTQLGSTAEFPGIWVSWGAFV